MESLEVLCARIASDFTETIDVVKKSLETGTVPAWSDLPMLSLVVLAIAAQASVLLLSNKGRRLLWDIFETMVASAIVVVLLVLLIAIPTGQILPVSPLGVLGARQFCLAFWCGGMSP